MRRLFHAGAIILVLSLPFTAGGQGRNRYDPSDNLENIPYNGRFTFSRIRYGGGGFGFGWGAASWAHDYPRADRHLPRILEDLTTLRPNLDRSNVFDLEDPEIFHHPVIYLSEPGFWRATEAGTANLRRYLLKGGFIIFDDFEGRQLYNLEDQLRRALPEYRLIQIYVDHPIFHSFFDMKSIDFPHPLVDVMPNYFGIFEDNDPSKRMLAIINHNSDLAEYWEWSDSGMFPVDFTSEAYKLGVNYIVYAMTH
jgi:hypothetical protein